MRSLPHEPRCFAECATTALARVALPLAIAWAAAGQGHARPEIPAPLRRLAATGNHPLLATSVNDGGASVSLVLEGALEDEALRSAGARVLSRRTNGTIHVDVPVARLDALLDLPGLTAAKPDATVEPLCDLSVPETGAMPGCWEEYLGEFRGETGRGVVVGIVYSGIDWDHGDFRRPDGSTRIVAIWDQLDDEGPAPREAGFAYGTEWDERAIDAGRARHTDREGAGTHAAGIAAGNGLATAQTSNGPRYIGMAPEADIIAVATTGPLARVRDAIDYIFRKALAAGKPAVACVCFGTGAGPHDGRSPFDSESIADLAGPGRIIVAGAGNDGRRGLHAEQKLDLEGVEEGIDFVVESRTEKRGNADAAGAAFVVVDAYYPSQWDLRVRVAPPDGLPTLAAREGESDAFTIEGARVSLVNERTVFDPSLSSVVLYLQGSGDAAAPLAGRWSMRVRRAGAIASAASASRADLSGTPARDGDGFDAWILCGNGLVAAFDPADTVESELVAWPAAAPEVIAVAAYCTKSEWGTFEGGRAYASHGVQAGDLAPFSSPGPLRNGRMKPDIAAPGMGIVSARSSTIEAPQFAAAPSPDAAHVLRSGTSMAAPHVAGAVALLLARDPFATPEKIKRELAATAARDRFTAAVPNARWGSGKLRVCRP